MDQATPQFNPADKTILVVEDEPSGRNLLAAALKRSGYSYLLCSDGQEAVEEFRQQTDRIDLVLMDLNMPRMNGNEAFNAMIQIDPEVRVIIMTGFREADQIQDLLQRGVRSILHKPFRLTELADSIRDHL